MSYNNGRPITWAVHSECENSQVAKYDVGQIVSYKEQKCGCRRYGMIILSGISQERKICFDKKKSRGAYTVKLDDGTREFIVEDISDIKPATPSDFVQTGVFEGMPLSYDNGVLKGTLSYQDRRPLFSFGEVVYNCIEKEWQTIQQVDENMKSQGSYYYWVKRENGDETVIFEGCFSATPPKNTLVK